MNIDKKISKLEKKKAKKLAIIEERINKIANMSEEQFTYQQVILVGKSESLKGAAYIKLITGLLLLIPAALVQISWLSIGFVLTYGGLAITAGIEKAVARSYDKQYYLNKNNKYLADKRKEKAEEVEQQIEHENTKAQEDEVSVAQTEQSYIEKMIYNASEREALITDESKPKNFATMLDMYDENGNLKGEIDII